MTEGSTLATDATFDVRLKSITWEGEGVVSLRFVSPDGGLLPPFDPGAHADLHLPDGTIRQYSLCGDVADRGSYRIAVREIEGGRATSFIHRQLRTGMILKLGVPRNNFPFASAPRYLFVAGGIGLTPLLPMIHAARQAGADWSLLYCVREAKGAPFLGELRELGGHVTLFAPDQGTRLDVVSRLAQAEPGTILYCCGPERLMLAVAEATALWPAENVRFEWFAARSRPADETSGGFEVVCAQSGVTLTVPPNNSILGVLLEAGIPIARSCEQGVCGTCEVRVLEGRVDHRDSILSASEQETNQTMMTCVSRALGPRLVLDV